MKIAIEKKGKPPALLQVAIFEAKPNKLFSENQRAWVRFLRFNRPVACAECGKKLKVHWTALTEFVAKGFGRFALTDSGKIHPPLTAVCGDHPLALPPVATEEKANDPE